MMRGIAIVVLLSLFVTFVVLLTGCVGGDLTIVTHAGPGCSVVRGHVVQADGAVTAGGLDSLFTSSADCKEVDDE